MKTYQGNLIIKEGDTRDFSKLETITGALFVNSNVTFEAPQLTSVGGYLSVYSNVTFEAPQLTSVGGYLFVYSNVTLPQLTSVGGYLSVNSNVTLPQLTSVGGYLSVNSNVTLPQLTSVGGALYVYSNVTLPQLTSVGGDLSVNSNVTLNIKFLNKINYVIADGKVFFIESNKTSKGIVIYSGYNIKGVKNCKIKKHDTIYLASKDEFFSHGETIKKAVEDLQFKIISEKLKNEPIKKDTILTIQYYRLLTGACELGVKEWMSNNKIEEGIKAVELLPILEKTNAYGLSKFKQLINW